MGESCKIGALLRIRPYQILPVYESALRVVLVVKINILLWNAAFAKAKVMYYYGGAKMEEQKIKKVNVIYLLCYIFVPAIVCIACFVIKANYFEMGTMAVVFTMVPAALAVAWWTFAGKFIYKRKTKAFEAELDDTGFIRNQTFYSHGKNVIVDVNSGKIGLIFFWNPFETYVLPASRIERVWADDGCSGTGIMRGSSRVSFLFIIDGIRFRVDTFTSNQRQTMESDYIKKGVAKAEHMVSVLEEAKARSV